MPTRLLIDSITMQYPTNRMDYSPQLMDLEDHQDLQMLLLTFGNGIILEFRAEGESIDAIEAARGLAVGTGSCRPIQLTTEQKRQLWFYHEGDECYVQSVTPFACVMIDPIPRPEKFQEFAF